MSRGDGQPEELRRELPDELPQELRGRILVAGAGVSGRGVTRLLVDLGAQVVVAEDNPDAIAALRAEVPGVATCGVEQARLALRDGDLVVTSPGWRPDTPLLVDAAARGLEVIGDVELAWRLDAAGVFGAPRTWLVVTGTNGKTTTTAMLAAMLVADGRAASAVGNIGVAVADALRATPRVDVLVAELSSFQLHWAPRLVPAAGVVLNLADDHLDWHGSFANYAADKQRALRGPVVVLARDDARVNATPVAPDQRVIGFSAARPAAGDVGVVDDHLVYNADGHEEILAPAEGINPAGRAGILDAAAASAMALSQGVSPAAIATALGQFQVAGHRGQEVHRAGGVSWVDNSKATNPHAADAALTGVDNVVWIAGGQLKGASVDELVRSHAQRLRAAVVMGVDRNLVVAALTEYAPQVPVVVVDSTDPVAAMEQAVAAAADAARPGDTVLLAPAGASLDMYSGMGQRGDIFAAAAREVAGSSSR